MYFDILKYKKCFLQLCRGLKGYKFSPGTYKIKMDK